MSFANQTITVHGQGDHSTETTLGEIREHAQGTIDSCDGVAVEVVTDRMGGEYMASAMRGMCRTILALVDELERVTQAYYDANESA